MKYNEKLCPSSEVKIPKNRTIVFCDNLNFLWDGDPKGYFLVKIKKNFISCGFVNSKHKMIVEFRGKDPDKIIKEIVKRKICNLGNMGYIASELMLARYCLEKKKEYTQR